MIRVPALNIFMAELLQDQRILRGDTEDEDVILLSDNSKLPSNASQQLSRDRTIRTRPTLFTEGMGGLTQSRWSDSSSTSIHDEDAFFVNPPNSIRSSRWDSPPMVPKKKPSNASRFKRDVTILLKRPTSFTEGTGGVDSPRKTQFIRSSSVSSIHNWDACSSTPTSRWDSSPKVPEKDGLTLPQRLPEDNASIKIQRQKFRWKGK